MNLIPMTSPIANPVRRHLLQVAAAGLAGSVLPWQAHAQATWPTKPVTLVVPFPAGGGTDAFARPLSAQFSRLTGKQLIIDNRGGAGGTVGASIAAKAAPDGYTLFMGAVHHAISPSMYAKLDYDIEKDFVPLALVANVPQVLVVNPRSQSGEFKEFLERVRKSPGRFNYGSAGAGTSHHLAGELFKQQTRSFITHIPYRGAGPAQQDRPGFIGPAHQGRAHQGAHGVGHQAQPGFSRGALRGRVGPARLHRDHLVRRVGSQRRARRGAGPHFGRVAPGFGHRRAQGRLGRQRRRVRRPHARAVRQLCQRRGQALGGRGQGFWRQARLSVPEVCRLLDCGWARRGS